jgi:hypothetical protein
MARVLLSGWHDLYDKQRRPAMGTETAQARPAESIMLGVQHPDLYAELKQRFVSLPEPYGTRGWLVDLRNPFHPVAECYDTWAAADAACEQRIMQALVEMAAQECKVEGADDSPSCPAHAAPAAGPAEPQCSSRHPRKTL